MEILNAAKGKKGFIICCLLVVVFMEAYLLSHPSLQKKGISFESSCDRQYSFITPNIDCSKDLADETAILKKRTYDVVTSALATDDVARISVFYRNLQNFQWFGINENDNFAPGSILKIPIAMAYYKLSESDPKILSKKYAYTTDGSDSTTNVIQTIKPDDVLQNGSSYSAQDLISRMIRYSDNTAVPILAKGLNPKFLLKTYVDLGIYIPTSGGIDQNFVSVKTLASMIRKLYDASYLDTASSNDILLLMSQSAFHSGLAAGVPNTVKVANKFGEREDANDVSGDGNTVELHDCGVIYAPKNPYIICVMTQGKNIETLESAIANISKTIYENH